MDDFDPKDVSKTTDKKLGPKLGNYSFGQLTAMEAAERGASDPRKGMLSLLQGEISNRRAASPGVDLSPVSKARIAEAAHELNRAYCAALGDDSQQPWDDAPEWQRVSALAGVEFHIENPGAGDSASHDSWMAQKEAEGWKFGETKDAEKKEHPCMVPFDQLPSEQQAKDALFRQTVHALAPIFLEIERLEGARVREVIAEGDMASKGERKAKTLVNDIAELAFCDDDGAVLFKITPEPGEVQLRNGKAVFNRSVELKREKPRVELQQVVALDENGRNIARVRWAVPLIGGGGKLAQVPARFIAFNL